jgi:hypothetical protein
MSDLHESIVTLFKIHYPNVDHLTLDRDVLVTMIEKMLAADNEKFGDEIESDKVIDENYQQAHELIPNMLVQPELIYSKGRLNKVPVNILFDSGCQVSSTFMSVIQDANLEYLVDKKARTYCKGVNGVSITYGTLWFTKLELEISTDNFVSLPIKLSVCKDEEDVTEEDNEEEQDDNDDEVFGTTPDILLGLDFMETYGAIMDFNKKQIILKNGVIINMK